MTEQVSGPQGTKIAGRHMVMAPYYIGTIKTPLLTDSLTKMNKVFCSELLIKISMDITLDFKPNHPINTKFLGGIQILI